MTRVVAAFDFDGTLLPGDSLIPFLRRLLPAPALARAVRSAWREMVMLPRGGPHRDRAKQALLARALRGIPAEHLDIEAEAYSEVLERRLRSDVLERARWHMDEGHDVVIVSASPEVYLVPLAARLGFRTVLATRLEVDDAGRLTGSFIAANVRAAEKVRRLREWLGGREATIWAYGDSEGDRELLAFADHATRVTRRPLSRVPAGWPA